MGIESDAINDLFKDEQPAEVLLGSRKRKGKLPYPEETEFKFFVGCLNDPADRLEYEQLLTKSYRCQNNLLKPGDLAVLDMQGTFDKMGEYHVVSRYAILPDKNKD